MIPFEISTRKPAGQRFESIAEIDRTWRSGSSCHNMQGLLHAHRGNWQQAGRYLQEAISIAEHYAQVLRKTHRGREARVIEARLVSSAGAPRGNAIVDLSELHLEPR